MMLAMLNRNQKQTLLLDELKALEGLPRILSNAREEHFGLGSFAEDPSKIMRLSAPNHLHLY